ncbi:MAG: peptidoglycan DD-metalloendopeptidase family protein [Prevotella sp.]|nr:peptidoglycan DD-metalloendopeptidase family protein [Prevotella sp.]
MRRLLFVLLACCICLAAPAQRRSRQQRKPTQKEQLQTRQKKLREQRQANQQRQRDLELQVKQRMQDVEALGSDIDDNKLIIDSLHQETDTLNRHIAVLDSQLNVLKSELEERRQHYIKSLRYMYRNRNAQNRIMFVLSSQNFNQMYRRLRFMNEYTTYQKAQGEAVKQKSEQVTAKLSELNEARVILSALVDSTENQQRQLEARQAEQQRMVADLQKQQQTVKKLITQQQREEAEINRQIERIIAEELEKARKAEEERQRRLAEQRRREQEQQAQRQAQQDQQQSRRNNRRNNNSRGNNDTPTTPTYTPADPDRQLTGNFANNKGRLPVPITGSYRIVRGFGSYTMAGVTLQSNGIQLQGQEGAKARCVFDGEVSRVYNPGSGYYVMVRHGRYITVYGNLSSVSVSAGQHVNINQSIGTVGTGRILIFRLQNWDQPLNPKKWLRRL